MIVWCDSCVANPVEMGPANGVDGPADMHSMFHRPLCPDCLAGVPDGLSAFRYLSQRRKHLSA